MPLPEAARRVAELSAGRRITLELPIAEGTPKDSDQERDNRAAIEQLALAVHQITEAVAALRTVTEAVTTTLTQLRGSK